MTEDYEIFSNGTSSRWYHKSPFGALIFAEQQVTEQYGALLVGRTKVDPEDSDMIETTFTTHCSPQDETRRAKWCKQPAANVSYNLKIFYSDGGYRHVDRKGSAGIVTPSTEMAISFERCPSSTHAAYEVFAWVSGKAVEELQQPCEVIFVTDSSAIVLGFRNWGKKLIMESQFVALQHLSRYYGNEAARSP
eukprot:TRINITY_DN10033_c0_g1_i6.p1 TRINITY_DN10033_c0_g1~~TRINITY_DN10033_c0_g1_i6.p1  ORF type:complete len:212 (+),score=39.58 TRINITY_DN10033_c0_g1_i6:61-636(+)